MRDEKTMMAIILTVAEQDERIRGVYMNGSRANKHAPRDNYQDYDIVYVVDSVKSFIEDTSWLSFFGELAIIQEPDFLDQLVGREIDHADFYMFLMLFSDGNRIDLKICSKDCVAEEIAEDELVVKLLDKDNCLTQIPSQASDQQFWVQAPTEGAFILACNDFWWCLQNVAKGTKRQEFTYAIDMLETVIRPHLMDVLGWRVGIEHNFQVSIGKAGKFLPQFISQAKWSAVLATYARTDEDGLWQSIEHLMALFSEEAKAVAAHFGWVYHLGDERAIRNYVLNLKNK